MVQAKETGQERRISIDAETCGDRWERVLFDHLDNRATFIISRNLSKWLVKSALPVHKPYHKPSHPVHGHVLSSLPVMHRMELYVDDVVQRVFTRLLALLEDTHGSVMVGTNDFLATQIDVLHSHPTHTPTMLFRIENPSVRLMILDRLFFFMSHSRSVLSALPYIPCSPLAYRQESVGRTAKRLQSLNGAKVSNKSLCQTGDEHLRHSRPALHSRGSLSAPGPHPQRDKTPADNHHSF